MGELLIIQINCTSRDLQNTCAGQPRPWTTLNHKSSMTVQASQHLPVFHRVDMKTQTFEDVFSKSLNINVCISIFFHFPSVRYWKQSVNNNKNNKKKSVGRVSLKPSHMLMVDITKRENTHRHSILLNSHFNIMSFNWCPAAWRRLSGYSANRFWIFSFITWSWGRSFSSVDEWLLAFDAVSFWLFPSWVQKDRKTKNTFTS